MSTMNNIARKDRKQKIVAGPLNYNNSENLRAKAEYARKITLDARLDVHLAQTETRKKRAEKIVVYWETTFEVFDRMAGLCERFERRGEFNEAVALAYLLNLLAEETKKVTEEDSSDLALYRLKVMRKTIEDLFS